MATSFAINSLFFTFLVLSSSLQIESRESKFFSKVTHFSTINYNLDPKRPNFDAPIIAPDAAPASSPITEPEPEIAPVLAPVPAPVPAFAPIYRENGFGPGSGLVVPTTVNTRNAASDNKNKVLENEFDEESYHSSYNNNDEFSNSYKNNEFAGNYNNNGYRLSDSHETADSYNNNEFNNNNFGNAYASNYNNNELNSDKNYNSRYATNYNSNELNNDNSYNSRYTTNYNSNELNSDNNYNSRYTTNYNSNELNSDNNYNNRFATNYNDNEQNNNFNSGNNNNERQGMSDTRFVEGGKYYYDVNNEQNVDQSTSNGYSENTKEYANEFNTMEEYENQEKYNAFMP